MPDQLTSLRLLGTGVRLALSGAISSLAHSGERSCRNISSAVSSLIGKRSGGCIVSFVVRFLKAAGMERVLACLFMLWTCQDCLSGSK